jgi:hypothetical protein
MIEVEAIRQLLETNLSAGLIYDSMCFFFIYSEFFSVVGGTKLPRSFATAASPDSWVTSKG